MHFTFRFITKSPTEGKKPAHAPITEKDWADCSISYVCGEIPDAEQTYGGPASYSKEIQIVFRGTRWVGSCSPAIAADPASADPASHFAVVDEAGAMCNVSTIKMYQV